MKSLVCSRNSIKSLVVIISLLGIETSSLAKSSTLEAGTRVLLRLNQPISSDSARVGQPISFEIIEDVRMGNTLLFRRGALAIGTIIKARSKKSFGRSGNLSFRLDYATARNGGKVPLRTSKGNVIEVKQKLGENGSTPRNALVTASALVSGNPVGMAISALSFFKKGKEVGMPAGQLIEAYVAQSTNVPGARSDHGGSLKQGTQRRFIQSAGHTTRRRR